MLDKYCVFGNPIAHSLSPEIHSQFAKQTGEQVVYEKAFIDLGEFSLKVNEFFAQGGKGLNITVPFKTEAWELAKNLSERAKLAGAVNTLWLNENKELCGDNTDGAGLVSDILERNAWQIENKKILIIGAGGATRGVILPLLKEKPQQLTIANRTFEKAKQLQQLFKQYGNINATSLEELEACRFDLIINATSASLSGELPPLPTDIIHSGIQAYDMVYAKEPTAFMRWSEQHGAAAISDGLGMLVGQAAESFYLWRGVRPEVEPVIHNLRKR